MDLGSAATPGCICKKLKMDTMSIDYNRIILYSVIMSKSVKKYNPEDYKDAEFITIGDGPIRIQIVNAENLSAGHIATMVEKLFRIYSEMGLVKTIAEEQAK